MSGCSPRMRAVDRAPRALTLAAVAVTFGLWAWPGAASAQDFQFELGGKDYEIREGPVGPNPLIGPNILNPFDPFVVQYNVQQIGDPIPGGVAPYLDTAANWDAILGPLPLAAIGLNHPLSTQFDANALLPGYETFGAPAPPGLGYALITYQLAGPDDPMADLPLSVFPDGITDPWRDPLPVDDPEGYLGEVYIFGASRPRKADPSESYLGEVYIFSGPRPGKVELVPGTGWPVVALPGIDPGPVYGSGDDAGEYPAPLLILCRDDFTINGPLYLDGSEGEPGLDTDGSSDYTRRLTWKDGRPFEPAGSQAPIVVQPGDVQASTIAEPGDGGGQPGLSPATGERGWPARTNPSDPGQQPGQGQAPVVVQPGPVEVPIIVPPGVVQPGDGQPPVVVRPPGDQPPGDAQPGVGEAPVEKIELWSLAPGTYRPGEPGEGEISPLEYMESSPYYTDIPLDIFDATLDAIDDACVADQAYENAQGNLAREQADLGMMQDIQGEATRIEDETDDQISQVQGQIDANQTRIDDLSDLHDSAGGIWGPRPPGGVGAYVVGTTDGKYQQTAATVSQDQATGQWVVTTPDGQTTRFDSKDEAAQHAADLQDKAADQVSRDRDQAGRDIAKLEAENDQLEDQISRLELKKSLAVETAIGVILGPLPWETRRRIGDKLDDVKTGDDLAGAMNGQQDQISQAEQDVDDKRQASADANAAAMTAAQDAVAAGKEESEKEPEPPPPPPNTTTYSNHRLRISDPDKATAEDVYNALYRGDQLPIGAKTSDTGLAAAKWKKVGDDARKATFVLGVTVPVACVAAAAPALLAIQHPVAIDCGRRLINAAAEAGAEAAWSEIEQDDLQDVLKDLTDAGWTYHLAQSKVRSHNATVVTFYHADSGQYLSVVHVEFTGLSGRSWLWGWRTKDIAERAGKTATTVVSGTVIGK